MSDLDASTGNAAARPASRPAKNRRKSTSSPITVTRPDPAVWREALGRADGNPRRIEVLPDGQVVVHNRPVR